MRQTPQVFYLFVVQFHDGIVTVRNGKFWYHYDMSKTHTSRKTKKSGNWAIRQNRDKFVRQARESGLRARSVYKLEQIDKKYRLIKPGSKIADLGSTPGSWCQYAISRVTGAGRVVGVDLLPMKSIEGVQFIQGDFTDPAIHHSIAECFEDSGIDLVLSDMAPNITGIRITDQANAERLQHAVLAFCLKSLNRGGNLLTKLFEGESVSALRKTYNQYFEQVQMIKPDASRSESREIYLLARKFNGTDSINLLSDPDDQELF